ncbi:hypothetical protein [Phytoactinopolyspora endophytica]|uniref:hypothetical protein n=1 Tax=Phytoactinopolyspora endophytica TaxID=1642495 RepID=UPI00101D4323|nr:hypothetical protein [Phytoactinopolyspora endophytica]
MGGDPQALQRFLSENVPDRCTLRSALMEFAALQRGLGVERFDQKIILVGFPDSLVPFVGMSGPDTTRMGQLVCGFRDSQRQLWQAAGLCVAPHAVFLPTQPKTAAAYATELGWPVTVRPARLEGTRGITRGIDNSKEFRAAFRRADRAYGDEPGMNLVLVEPTAAGDRFDFYVVGDRLVSVTHRPTADVYVDVTDATHPRLAGVAVDAVTAIPGLAHAQVTMVAPTVSPADDAEPPYILEDVASAVTPSGQFPTQGQPRDVAGAIIDHYLTAPRWKLPHSVAHQPPADAGPAPGWLVVQ